MWPQSLCISCRHKKTIGNKRGSTFLLCRLSQEDPDFDKYPMQPVFRCRGYLPVGDPAGADMQNQPFSE